MAEWSTPDKGRAVLQILGGEMVAQRIPGGVRATWTSRDLPDFVVATNLPMERFALDPQRAPRVDKALIRMALLATWIGIPPTAAPDLTEFLKALQVCASWVAGTALRDHLAKVHPAYLESRVSEAPPTLLVAPSDPI